MKGEDLNYVMSGSLNRMFEEQMYEYEEEVTGIKKKIVLSPRKNIENIMTN